MENQRVQSLLKEGPVTLLFFDDDNIMLEVIKGQDPSDQTTHQAGSMQHIFRCLQSEPATAFELEAAIVIIEDELEPIILSLPAHRSLVTFEPVIHQIAEFCSDSNKSVLEVEEVELLFNRLADVAYGTPARMLGIPENRDFAAALLYLRELMHHAGFSTITILKSL